MSGICIIPLMLFGVVNPVVGFVCDKDMMNPNLILAFSLILGVALSVILGTITIMLRYVPHIDKLEEKTEELRLKEEQLDKLINHYNKLIKAM